MKLSTFLMLAALAVVPGHIMAQMSTGTKEVTGFAGVADGEATFGGAFGRAFSDRLFVFGEGSRINGGSNNSFPGISASASAFNVNGGVHYQFTTGARFVPYGAAGFGVTRVSASASGAGFSTNVSDSSLMFNFGGGARFYMGPKWGIRPELMVFTGDGSYTRFTVGLFYQF